MGRYALYERAARRLRGAPLRADASQAVGPGVARIAARGLNPRPLPGV